MVGDLSGEFKTSYLTIVHTGGEASTIAIRQTLGTFCHLRKLVSPGLIESDSHDARGSERD
jgi:hypothetical protein